MTRSKITYQLIQLLGLFGVGIGLLTMCGYMVGNPTLYTWEGSIGMALNTAVVVTLYGFAIYLTGKHINDNLNL